mmetsp:Transcript_40449/g.160560  ORF Transcript_40449/g.160560 Transcript_40449/m.160560 type:complete len:162 (-) Transcript_40449:1535-2020(-)
MATERALHSLTLLETALNRFILHTMTDYHQDKLPDSISARKRMSLNECVEVVETNWVLVFESSPLGKEEDTAKGVLVRLKKMAESVTSGTGSVRPTTLKRIVSNVKYLMTLINAPELKTVELLENGQASGCGQGSRAVHPSNWSSYAGRSRRASFRLTMLP